MPEEELSRRKQNRGRTSIEFENEGRVRQSETDDSDINKIMGKFRATGQLTHTNLARPVYGDFSTTLDYQTARNSLLEATKIFDSLPARVRQRGNNDPAELIDFVANPDNDDELRELGLKNPILERDEEEEKPPEVTPGED